MSPGGSVLVSPDSRGGDSDGQITPISRNWFRAARHSPLPRLLSLLLWTGRLTPGSIGLPAGQQSIAMPVLFPHGTGRVSRVYE